MCIIVSGGQSLTCIGWSIKLSGADDIVSSAIIHRDQEQQMRAATLASDITIKFAVLTRCCCVPSPLELDLVANRFADLFLCQRQPHSVNSQRNARPVDRENIL